ncbi:hypothetical protein [Ideonella sp. A 288]|uniref:hypothetical protein n=1 Tax=Ideonella sp. A 288 TaxID=1962181 RepID=UPI000B4B7032|nr:hypothetical protein [Ideonella sp. A 288]
MNLTNNRFAVGKYLVSPMTRQLDDGRYAPSVSIRSGRGSGTHDRVIRLDARFATHAAAIAHATEHGMSWLRQAPGG